MTQASILALAKLIGDILRGLAKEVKILVQGIGDETRRLMVVINLTTLFALSIVGLLLVILLLFASPFGGVSSVCTATGVGVLTLISLCIVGAICIDKVLG